MEATREPKFDEHAVLYRDDNRSYRKERIYCGVLGILLGLALCAFGLSFYPSNGARIAVGVAAAAFVAVGVAQIVAGIRLKRYPYNCVVDMNGILLREKERYLVIAFDELGVVRFHCKTLQGGFDGAGHHRLEIIDGAVYYFIGDLKRRFATRDAAKLAFIIDHRRLNDTYRDWGDVYDRAVKNYKNRIIAKDDTPAD